MSNSLKKVADLRAKFTQELETQQQTAHQLLKDNRLRILMQSISRLPITERQAVGRALNDLQKLAASSSGRPADQFS